MARDILRLPGLPLAAEVEPRRAALFCVVLLIGGCALASCALACATPFAAYAVIAAAMLPLSSALLVVAAAWVVNQGIGFGVLHYPHDLNTLLWGFAIAVAALIATGVSKLTLVSLPRVASPVALGLTWIGAYAAYEVALLAFTPALGGAGSFTLAIVVRLGLLSAVWLIGLVGACEVFCLLNAMTRRRITF